MDNEEVTKYLKSMGYITGIKLNATEFIGVYPFLYTVAIVRGRIKDIEIGYEDRWCYKNANAALYAVTDWAIRGYEGEPEGWHRHPSSGRRRPEGDKEREFINR